MRSEITTLVSETTLAVRSSTSLFSWPYFDFTLLVELVVLKNPRSGVAGVVSARLNMFILDHVSNGSFYDSPICRDMKQGMFFK